jgi:hypothetical protein
VSHQQLSLLPDLTRRSGYVYAVLSTFSTAIKFGYTTNPRRRGGEYRDGVMLCYWPGDRADEGRIHDQLEPWRLQHNREWYQVTPEIVWFLVNKCLEGNFPRGLRLLRTIQRDMGWGETESA